MSTYADLVIEVRAQIDVSDAVAYGWLLERARVLNAEAAWLLAEAQIPAVTGQGEYALPSDCVRTEAVRRCPDLPARTLTQISRRVACGSPRPVYSDAAETDDRVFAISPPPTTGNTITLRYLADVPDEGPTGVPPFPPDITPVLVDGAIGQGLARMDERFDSAAYFEARFTDGIARLRRRRAGRAGRGPIPIRVDAMSLTQIAQDRLQRRDTAGHRPGRAARRRCLLSAERPAQR
jgi:hypothetical protein